MCCLYLYVCYSSCCHLYARLYAICHSLFALSFGVTAMLDCVLSVMVCLLFLSYVIGMLHCMLVVLVCLLYMLASFVF